MEISVEQTKNGYLCKYRAKDGSIIKMKYQFYRLSEAKKMFKNYIISNGLI